MLAGLGELFILRDSGNNVIYSGIKSISMVEKLLRESPEKLFSGDGIPKLEGMTTNFEMDLDRNTTSRDIENAWKSYQMII